MKKLILLAAILTMGLTAAAPALAQIEPANGVQGFITSISGAVVLVEEVPSDEWGSDKGAFTVTEETAILRQQGDELVPGTFDDLQAGQHVAATYAGPVAESYPTQGTAGSIIVLELPVRISAVGLPGSSSRISNRWHGAEKRGVVGDDDTPRKPEIRDVEVVGKLPGAYRPGPALDARGGDPR